MLTWLQCLLLLGVFTPPTLSLQTATYVPPCSCSCCTVQTCDGVFTRRCPGGKDPQCLVDQKSKGRGCTAWLDPNFLPLKCKPQEVWSRHPHITGWGNPAPESMDNNEFCNMFCDKAAKCDEKAIPTLPPPTCCPCKGNTAKVTPPQTAKDGTVVVNKPHAAASFLAFGSAARNPPPIFMQTECSPSCCNASS